MPRFQAHYFDRRDDTVPRRTEPVEAPDLATALEWASAALAEDEIRVELTDPRKHMTDIPSMLGEAAVQVHDRYVHAKETADALYGEAEQFVRKRPYVALGVAALFGYLVGLHVHGGRQVIYLKTDH